METLKAYTTHIKSFFFPTKVKNKLDILKTIVATLFFGKNWGRVVVTWWLSKKENKISACSSYDIILYIS